VAHEPELSSAPAEATSDTAFSDRREALLLEGDLFFVVRVTETLKHAGYATHAVRSEHDFAQALLARRPVVTLVNTAARGVDYARALAAARAAGIPSVAYGPHVDLESQIAARAAGATVVVTNSRLAADLPGIVARAVRRGAEAPEAEPTDASQNPPDDSVSNDTDKSESGS
jgi:hypothetical protein